MSDALMLKYRPHKLADVVGQEHVVQTLNNALLSKNFHHAYLFQGSFGCGKTTTARIVAAMLNCEAHKGPTAEPCGKCQMCREIFEGRCNDVREINAADNRKIEDIRALVEYVRECKTLIARYKVVILDEVHALTPEAAESALKLIEEPPSNVIFILATTDAQKMKATIHSRCMPFRFGKVAWPQLLTHLKSVAEQENIEADDAALRLAARLSKGSPRNALNNLQQLITFAGGQKITAEIAQNALGAVSENDYFALVDAIVSKDASSGMKIIQSVFGHGQDVEQITNGLLEHLRTLMVMTSCKDTAGLIYLSDEEKKKFGHQYAKVNIKFVVAMIKLLYEATSKVMVNLNPQTLFETFLIQSIIAGAEIEKAVKTTA
jgi:DNA polymerase-3 subunit gamma/tau